MAVFENSRYLHTILSNRLGWEVPTLDIRERFVFNEANCTLYTWLEGDTLDGVAYKFYNKTALRWAILDANPKYRTEFAGIFELICCAIQILLNGSSGTRLFKRSVSLFHSLK